jgi:hypothetical protein
LSLNNVGHGLGLHQVKTIIEKGPLCELTRLGKPYWIGRAGKTQTGLKHRTRGSSTPMALKLQAVFARKRTWPAKKKGKPLIKRLTLG